MRFCALSFFVIYEYTPIEKKSQKFLNFLLSKNNNLTKNQKLF